MPSTNQTDLAGRECVRWTTYSSTQETNCARCGERKHTPLRIDRMGGYVCLTCIDAALETALAKIEALEAEHTSLEAAGIEALERAAEAEARVTALEGALRGQRGWHDSQRDDLGKPPPNGENRWRRAQHQEQIDLIDTVFAALLNPDPAEQPEAGR